MLPDGARNGDTLGYTSKKKTKKTTLLVDTNQTNASI